MEIDHELVATRFEAIAQELTDHPDHWTRKILARDADGRECAVDDPRAHCWCAMGLLFRDFSRDDDGGARAPYLERYITRNYADKLLNYTTAALLGHKHETYVGYNDTRAEVGPVITLFKRAAEFARAKVDP